MTLALSITGGFQSRYLLRSGLLTALQKQGLPILILSPNPDEAYFRQEFSQPGINLALLDQAQYKEYAASTLQKFLCTLRGYARYDIPSIRDLYESSRQKRPLFAPTGWVFDGCAWALNQSPWLQEQMIAWEARTFVPGFSQDLLRQHRPKVLVSTSMGTNGWETDAYILREAQKLGITTVACILSWDNTTTKGLRGVTPDYIFAWTKKMKEELVTYHRIDPDRVLVTGIAHFDYYFQPIIQNRKEFLTSQGLDPERKTLFFATHQPVKYPYHDDLIKMLGGAIAQDLFNQPVQIVVRLHPNFFFYWTSEQVEEFRNLCRSYPHLHINEPQILSTRLKLDMATNEMPQLHHWLTHSDVMLNIFSTMAIEACLHDLPVVNIGFNGYATKPISYRQDVNIDRRQVHNQRIIQAGAAPVAEDLTHLIQLVNQYLDQPTLHRANRHLIAQQECEFLDGGSCGRIAQALAQAAGL